MNLKIECILVDIAGIYRSEGLICGHKGCVWFDAKAHPTDRRRARGIWLCAHSI
jgi:hypothetical protein